MKRNVIIRIVLFSLAIVVLLGILLAGIGARYFMTAWHTSGISEITHNVGLTGGTVAASGSVQADEIRSIEVDWAAGAIRIVRGDTDRIEFSETAVENDKYPMVWKQSGDKLILQFCETDRNWFGFSFDGTLSKELVITVPRDWIGDELELNVASAVVSVKHLAIHNVDFNGASGTLTLDDCTVEELDIDTASGDIRFSGSLDVLDCDAVSADCVLSLTNNPSRISIDSVSGDLTLFLPEDCGFTVGMDTISGDFASEFASSESGKFHIYGDGRCRISVSGVSGDLAVRRAEGHSGEPTIPQRQPFER